MGNLKPQFGALENIAVGPGAGKEREKIDARGTFHHHVGSRLE